MFFTPATNFGAIAAFHRAEGRADCDHHHRRRALSAPPRRERASKYHIAAVDDRGRRLSTTMIPTRAILKDTDIDAWPGLQKAMSASRA